MRVCADMCVCVCWGVVVFLLASPSSELHGVCVSLEGHSVVQVRGSYLCAAHFLSLSLSLSLILSLSSLSHSLSIFSSLSHISLSPLYTIYPLTSSQLR